MGELPNSQNFSNAAGCGLPPIGSPTKVITGTKKECKTVLGKQICINVPTVKTVPNQEYIDKLKKYNACISAAAKGTIDQVTNTIKKATKKISELTGKAKLGMQKRLRKAILKRVSGAIRINSHGMATILYPATISENQATSLHYKKSFITKAKNSYNDVLVQWKALGGTQATLNEAIAAGARKRIHKFKKSPYTTNTTPAIQSSKKSSFDGGWSNWTGEHSNVMGPIEYEDEIPENSTPDPSQEIETPEEIEALDEQGADEGVDNVEKQRGFKAFIQRILAIFRRNKASEEIPYEEATTEAANYFQDKMADQNDLPTGGDGSDLNDILTGTAPDDNKLLGMPKPVAYGVIILGAALLAFGGYKLYKHLKK